MTDVLLLSAGEAPLLVYGESGRLTNDEDLERPEGDKLWSVAATAISSVYFDSPDMYLYKKRLARHEGARLFRIRWYGDKPKGEGLVFLELKTHHEKWVNVLSVKERVVICERDVKTILSRTTKLRIQDAQHIVSAANPKLSGHEFNKATGLLVTMHDLVVRLDLRPCVRSTYRRVAFQAPANNKLRLTVDRNIMVIDESTTLPGQWCLDDTEITEEIMARVPFDVFEVKLAGSSMPPSMQTLLHDGTIIEAPKFSKFLTGAAKYNISRLEILPHWAEYEGFRQLFTGVSFIKSHSQTRSSESSTHGLWPSKVSCNDDFEQTSSSSLGCDASVDGNQKRSKRFASIFSSGILPLRSFSGKKMQVAPNARVKVEPKSYFANERTFIQWISAALLLITISVILLDFAARDPDHSMIPVGLALLFGAALIVFHAIFSYLRRVRLLTRGEPYGYVDHCGPTILTLAILLGLGVVTFVFLSIHLESRNLARQASFQIRSNADTCITHAMDGISLLEYQPSDVVVLPGDDPLLIPSLDTVRRHRSTGPVDTLITIPGSDLEGLTSNADGTKLYALSEAGGNEAEIMELQWTALGGLEVVRRWSIATPNAEGIAFVPAQTPGMPDMLYVGGGNKLDVGVGVGQSTFACSIDVYHVPTDIGYNTNGNAKTQLQGHPLNSNLLSDGLLDSKIASLQYFEGALYVLHDNALEVRVWGLDGTFLSKWKLPPVSKQWEGMALERRHDDSGVGVLRGSHGGGLWLHLTLDSPPQVWTLAVREGKERGGVILPNCAVMQGRGLINLFAF
jgi:uncharacterized membrane protein YidH (DUF202 family)